MSTIHDASKWSSYFQQRCDEAGGLLPYFVDENRLYYPYVEVIRKNAHDGDRILETGFGTGFTSILLGSYNAKYGVYAIDIDPDVISNGEKNNKYFNGRVTFRQANMFELPFEDDYFSIVYHYGVMEHFDEKDIVRALKENLRVGRKVIFGVPTNNLESKANTYGDERLWGFHKWDTLLRKNGFKVVGFDGWLPKNNIFYIAAYLFLQATNLYLIKMPFVKRLKCRFAKAILFVLERN